MAPRWPSTLKHSVLLRDPSETCLSNVKWSSNGLGAVCQATTKSCRAMKYAASLLLSRWEKKDLLVSSASKILRLFTCIQHINCSANHAAQIAWTSFTELSQIEPENKINLPFPVMAKKLLNAWEIASHHRRGHVFLIILSVMNKKLT